MNGTIHTPSGKVYSVDMPTQSHRMIVYEPDPKWSFTDSAGHVHRWVDGKLPTARQETLIVYDDYGDDYEDAFDVCRECGERVNPGLIARDSIEHRVVAITYRIDGEIVGEAEFRRGLEAETSSLEKVRWDAMNNPATSG